MKYLWRLFLFLFLFSSILEANLHHKSAIFYYGKAISYPMVGIHDYIFVEPKNTNTYTHGFSVYKNKIYAHIKLDANGNILEKVNSLVRLGYKNIYFEDTEFNKENIENILNKIVYKYPKIKLVLKSTKQVVSRVQQHLEAVVVESYQDKNIENLLSYGIDIIDIELKELEKEEYKELVKKIMKKGMIPYITSDFSQYGFSSKIAIKREILTLIDESNGEDRMTIGAHQYGALSIEYLGYIQKLYDVSKGLPNVDGLTQYAGVVVWLNQDYKNPLEIIEFFEALKKRNIKVVFVNNFGTDLNGYLLNTLDIESDESSGGSKRIVYRDKMIGYEIEPSLSNEYNTFLTSDSAEPLLVLEDSDGMKSIPIAVMPWGGYAMRESCITILNEENLWVPDPFAFFQKVLRLKPLLVPDPSTENGNRLFFTHVDGDGIMNKVESNPDLFSGDILYKEVLKKFKIPHSISVIGAEIDPDGLYPKLSKRLSKLTKDMYALSNVEAATHTFTHPYYWGKIKNGFLPKKYRLKVKNYTFNYDRELKQCLNDINTKHLPKGKRKADTVYWTGDCSPRLATLDYIYKNKIFNINGGDTTINNLNPWLARIAPLGLERGEYYQIFTGAQNENVYTNDWLGPFWGFKKVVQTFKLTNSPRRLKPIDIYYHIYSGSKTASLNALRYVFKWSMKQDVMPIYTSTYIPKAMDYFIVSIANEGSEWLVDGMKNLKTLRIEKKDAFINLKKSKTTVGIKHFENHTYISLNEKQQHFIKDSKKHSTKESYLISANAKIVEFHKGKRNQKIHFKGEVDLKLHFNVQKGCKVLSLPKATQTKKINKDVILNYKNHKEATLTIECH